MREVKVKRISDNGDVCFEIYCDGVFATDHDDREEAITTALDIAEANDVEDIILQVYTEER